ncbi:MAG: lipocalin family protein [Chitinophagales bacterium]
MKKILFLPVVALFLLFTSCTQEPSKIIGSWKLEKMNLDGAEVFPNVLGNPTYLFFDDNRYEQRASGQFEQGTYKIDDKKLTIRFNDLDKVTVMQIVELTENKFVYKIGEESISTVYLVR